MKTTCARCIAALAIVFAAGQVHAAPILYDIDTSSLMGLGEFSFDAILIDGDGAPNTTITIDALDLGGGSAVGGATLGGGASGSLGGGISLSDALFFTSFTQLFLPGSFLRFQLDVVTTASGVPAPDGFQFSILDAAGIPVATLDPSGLDAVILGDLAAGATVLQSFPLQTTAVPEPTSLLLFGGGLAAVAARAWRRRTGSTPPAPE